MNVITKHYLRKHKRASEARAKIKALPKMPRIMLSPGYVNPITLNFPRGSLVVYEITNHATGRKDYFDKNTFWTLMKRMPNNYWLLMADPKKPLPGVRNPMTRSNVYPRNVRRVTVAPKPKTPSRSAAARKIASALRKKVATKKKNNSRKSH